MAYRKIPQMAWMVVLSVLHLTAAAMGSIIYVDKRAEGLKDGTSWVNACADLQAALDKANPGDEIRVAQGIYLPATTNKDREATFMLVKARGAWVKGGYAGVSDPGAPRDWIKYPSILSGDFNGDDTQDPASRAENAYNVIWAEGTDEATVLDGFVICGGNANGVRSDEIDGGGIYMYQGGARIVNCMFRNNYARNRGAGIFCQETNGLYLENCRFENNVTENSGGGLHICYGKEPVYLQGCVFVCNLANTGAGYYSTAGTVSAVNCGFFGNLARCGAGAGALQGDSKLTNCIFSGNEALFGAGILNIGGGLELVNCTLSANKAEYMGGGVYSDAGEAPVITNCIFWRNTGGDGLNAQVAGVDGVVARANTIQDCPTAWALSDNNGLNPRFVDYDGKDNVVGTEDDDLHLLATSPCRDTGDTQAVSGTVDYAGQSRIVNGTVDRGALEFYDTIIPGILHVDGRARGVNDGSSWENAFTDLQDALRLAVIYAVDNEIQIRVAVGVYRPAGSGGRRDASFQLVDGVTISGGWAGAQNPDACDPGTYPTVLSGDLNGNDAEDPDLLLDNSYNVVTAYGVDASAVLTGFTITGGNANDSRHNAGGGLCIIMGSPTIENCRISCNRAKNGGGASCIFSHPDFTNCTFADNAADSGGAIYCEVSNPMIAACSILDNRAEGYGGGVYCANQSSPTIRQSTLSRNIAHFGGGIFCFEGACPVIEYNVISYNRAEGVLADGGGICCFNSHPEIRYNLIVRNFATDDGGGIYMEECMGQPLIDHCTVAYNVAHPSGGGIDLEETNLRIENCIIWGNGDDVREDKYGGEDSSASITIKNSCIEDAGDNAPYFRDPDRDDFTLVSWSPYAGLGMGAYDNGGPAADTDGDGLPDLWEEEYFGGIEASPDTPAWQNMDVTVRDVYQAGLDPRIPPMTNIYVSATAAGGDADGSKERPFPRIQQAVDAAVSHPKITVNIYVTYGTFYEHVLIDGKCLAILGGYDANFNPAPENTVLNGSGTGRPLLFVNTGGDASRPGGSIGRFTITGGYERDGAGVYLFESSPRIHDCLITGNEAFDDGGGISCYDNSNPLVENCTIEKNTAVQEAGGVWARYSGPIILRNCIIRNNTVGNNGAGVCLYSHSSVVLENCDISDNVAGNKGGGIWCQRDSWIEMTDCTIFGNTAAASGDGIRIERNAAAEPMPMSGVIIDDDVWIEGGIMELQERPDNAPALDIRSGHWMSRRLVLEGPGRIELYNVTMRLENCILRCDLKGTGTVTVPLQSELIIEDYTPENGPSDRAEIRLAGGGIRCDGLLTVRGHTLIEGCDIRVSRAHFLDAAEISNNVITAEAGAPYGQFYVEDSVDIVGNTIIADGDRYMDISAQFDGDVRDNFIHVVITEGADGTPAALLELRGEDTWLADLYDANVFLRPVHYPLRVPDFTLKTWTIDRLEVRPGSKVNLTNRFDFGNGGPNEVIYVKELILHEDSVLNTAFHRIYYDESTSSIDSKAVITNVPLLGFSLNNIAFDDGIEFLIRVTTNNSGDSLYPRYHVRRVVACEPDEKGMMIMTVLEDADPGSGTFGRPLPARAVGLFAKASPDEQRILVQFEYLFELPTPDMDLTQAELVIYLVDSTRRMRAGSLRVPLDGQPGSPGSGRFGVFHRYVDGGGLDFIRGTRIELELGGPDGTSILIDNFDPQVLCSDVWCRDVTGNDRVGEEDLLTVIGECPASAGLDAEGNSRVCLEGPFSDDGVVDWLDVEGWFWVLSTADPDSLCGAVALTCPAGPAAKGLFSPPSKSSGFFPYEGHLLIGGKRGAAKTQDRLYFFDGHGTYVDYFEPVWPQACGRIALDAGNKVYQLHTTQGLAGIADPSVVIGPAIFDDVDEPRYGTRGRVSVGLQTMGSEVFGRPVLDVAFDRWGCAYVLPVVVDPNSGDPNDMPYLAAAQIEFTPGQHRPYRICRLYDDPDAAPRSDGRRDNRVLNNLREIEVDSHGNLYVVNTNTLNDSAILWKYDAFTGAMLERVKLTEWKIVSPTLCVAEDQGCLYVGSSGAVPDANSCTVHCLRLDDLTIARSIRIKDMGHITGITHDPATGKVFVVGARMWDIPDNPTPAQLPFYYPYLAVIEPGVTETTAIALSDPASTAMGNDLALPMSVVWIPEPVEPCGQADINQDGRVDLADFLILSSQWLVTGAGLLSDIAPPPDGIVDVRDLAILAEGWLDCTN